MGSFGFVFEVGCSSCLLLVIEVVGVEFISWFSEIGFVLHFLVFLIDFFPLRALVAQVGEKLEIRISQYETNPKIEFLNVPNEVTPKRSELVKERIKKRPFIIGEICAFDAKIVWLLKMGF